MTENFYFWMIGISAVVIFIGYCAKEPFSTLIALVGLIWGFIGITPYENAKGHQQQILMDTRRQKTLSACISKSPTCLTLITQEDDEQRRKDYLQIYNNNKITERK